MFEKNQLNQIVKAMKPLFTIIGLGLMLSFSSCFIGDDGDVGPVGPRGDQGLQGEPGEEAFVFDYEGVSFTGPDYQVVLPYADDFVALDSDVTLVYFKWGEDEVDGEIVEVWRSLPQTIIDGERLIQYSFDWTIFDVKLLMSANFPLDELTAIDTDNWVVRLVVVPGKYWNGRREVPSYEDLKSLYNLPERPVIGQDTERRK